MINNLTLPKEEGIDDPSLDKEYIFWSLPMQEEITLHKNKTRQIKRQSKLKTL